MKELAERIKNLSQNDDGTFCSNSVEILANIINGKRTYVISLLETIQLRGETLRKVFHEDCGSDIDMFSIFVRHIYMELLKEEWKEIDRICSSYGITRWSKEDRENLKKMVREGALRTTRK